MKWVWIIEKCITALIIVSILNNNYNKNIYIVDYKEIIAISEKLFDGSYLMSCEDTAHYIIAY